MKHPGITPSSGVTIALFAAALWLPGAAGALALGDLQVHSALGEPLDASVAVSAGAEETLTPECFFLSRPEAVGAPQVSRATFALETTGGRGRLRIRTFASQNEPALLLRLNAACSGGGAVIREYAVLLDPRPQAAPAQATPPAPMALPVPAPAPAGASAVSAPGLRSVAGDTLASLAHAIYPRNRAAREAYVVALRTGNPPLAALASDEPIPPGTAVTLPDLREFALSLKLSPAPARIRPAPREGVPAKGAPAPATEAKPAPRSSREGAKGPAAARSARRAPAAARGDFVLRLSASDIDLSRTQGVDDRMRAQLRERLLLLDSDDQVSALLAMRSSLKQLEGRVAELQLKLSGLPGTPASATSPATSPATAAPAPAPTAATTPAPAVPAAIAPVNPPTAAPEPSPNAPAPQAKPAAKPAPAAVDDRPASPLLPSSIPAWLWGALALVAALVAVLGWSLYQRRHRPMQRSPVAEPTYATTMLDRDEAPEESGEPSLDEPGKVESPQARRTAESDAGLETHVRGADPQVLRRRYMEERFPEIAARTIALEDADSVVKGARLFYEDGALTRAVELLQFTVEENPGALKPWLALFEIFRLEGLAGEFAELAGRFREAHGSSDYWKKVQYIGRELDPGNPLYQDAAFNSLETIGYPAAAKRQEIVFDPLAENWLNAPMDFTSDALTADLRAGLLADGGVRDQDLIPNPMPALKSIEMFTVA